MAMKMPSRILKKECAAILETMKVRPCLGLISVCLSVCLCVAGWGPGNNEGHSLSQPHV